ncbi:hypothetical protein V5799_033496 [Amblyomma americanum]|uniref:Uncharacterized protein n=1 Tax=Amblyomma americanum TaxID=6943 RepID=A0AAQ4DN59_AMBAM
MHSDCTSADVRRSALGSGVTVHPECIKRRLFCPDASQECPCRLTNAQQLCRACAHSIRQLLSLVSLSGAAFLSSWPGEKAPRLCPAMRCWWCADRCLRPLNPGH